MSNYMQGNAPTFCSNCGSRIVPGDAFCRGCGAKVEMTDPRKARYDLACTFLKNNNFSAALSILNELGDYEDAQSKAKKCAEKIAEANKEMLYSAACDVLNSNTNDEVQINRAIEALSGILDYKDAAAKRNELEDMRANWQKVHEERIAEQKKQYYDTAVRHIENKQYLDAIGLINLLGDYEGAAELAKQCADGIEEQRKEETYSNAIITLNSENKSEQSLVWAIEAFKSLGKFKDSEAKLDEAEAALNAWLEAKHAAEEAERKRKAAIKAKRKKRRRIIAACFSVVLVTAIVLGAIFATTDRTIEYDLAGGTLSEDNKTSYTFLSDDFTLINPTKDGYTFLGWTGTDLDEPTLTVTVDKYSYNDRSYTANWQANTYTVTLDNTTNLSAIKVTLDSYYEGSTPTVVSLKNGETFSYPEPPTRSGYAFAGWYTDTSYTTMYSFTGTLSENITLYAMWKPMVSYSTSKEYIDIADYADDSNRMYFSDITSSSSSYAHYYYFTIYKTGSYTFNAVHSAGDFCISAYNVSKNSYVMSNTNLYSGNSNESSYFSAIAGDVIYVSIYNYSSTPSTNGSGYFYVSGASYPASTATAICSDENVYAYDDTLSEAMTVEYDASFTLPVPTRYGYGFDGWYYGETKIENGVWNIASDVNLTAHWLAGANTVTLNPNGGTVSSTSLAVTFDEYYTLPTPERTGYTFVGWYNGETLYESGIWSEDEDVTLVAAWKANEYTVTLDGTIADVVVTFDYNYEGSTATVSTLAKGQTLSRPTNPTRSDYVFTGWYTDSSCTSRYSFTGDITSDTTLYAGWKQMSMSYAYSETQLDPAYYNSSSYYYLTSTSSTSSSNIKHIYLVAEESGTHYIYWKNSNSSSYYCYYLQIYNLTTGTTIRSYSTSGTSSTSFGSYYSSFSCSAGDVIVVSLYRYYTSYSSTAYFYFNGFSSAPTSSAVSNSDSPKTVNVTYGEEFTLPTLSKTGSAFLGWYDEDDNLVENGVWNTASDVTLTPKWEAGKNMITLNPNSGSVSSSSIKVTYDESYTLPTPERTGYTFGGWYNGSTPYTGGTWTELEDVTLTAHWDIINYDISYVMNGGTNPSSNPSTYNIDSSITLNQPTKPGYTFAGWTGTGLTEPTMDVEINSCTEDRIYTATWTVNTYKISLNYNDGITSNSDIYVNYGGTYTLPNPERTGYTFGGWYNGSTPYTSGTWTGLEDVTLVAQWTGNQYTVTLGDTSISVNVTYNYNYSGSTSTIINVPQGQTLSRPTNPTRSDYVFTGWYTDSACTNRYSFTGDITGDMTLYAGWKQMSMSYTYNENQVDPTYYNSSSSYYSASTNNTSSSNRKHIYLVAEESGTHYIQWKNSSQSSYYAYYLQIYNLTTGTYIRNNSYSNTSSTSFTGNFVSFSCSAGDVIVVSFYRYSTSYSSTAYFYFSGFSSAPTSTATPKGPYHFEEDCSATLNVTYGSAYTLPTISKTGYAFLGWYDEDDNLVENGVWNTLSNMTLTPKWETGKNMIMLNPNGGSVSYSSIKITQGESYTLPTPERTGYTFGGWYDGSTPYTSGTWTGMNDVTLVAKWTANEHTVTFANIDCVYASVTVTFDYKYSGLTNYSVTLYNGQTLSYPTVPTRSNYLFGGWYTDSSCTNLFNFNETITEDITLYAKWAYISNNYSKILTIGSNTGSTAFNTVIKIYPFVSLVDQTITIYTSHSSGDPKIYLYDSNMNQLAVDDDGYSTYRDSLITYTVTAGTLYYAGFGCYSSGTGYMYITGTYTPSTHATASPTDVDGYVYSYGSSESYSVTYGEEYALPVPTRTGYTFGGWQDQYGNLVEDGAWSIDNDITLYAIWY